MGKSSSFRSVLPRIMVVFAFVVFILCYYEYNVVFSASTTTAITQQKNLRQEKIDRRLGSIASITLASIGDLSHFNYIYFQVVFWMGPLTTVFSIQKEEHAVYDSLVRNSLFPSRVHLLIYESDMTSFPINMLRNIAYKNSDTTHVLVTDIDIFPDASLYSSFLSLPQSLLDDPKQVIVLPLFETTHYVLPCSNWFSCSNQMNHFFQMKKYDLRMCTLTNACSNLGNNGVNQYVNQHWFFLSKHVMFTKYSCWGNTRQQPFVIVRKSHEIPEFYEYLKDFGFNRLEWINHLRFRGFEFNLLSQSWLYHVKHHQSHVAQNYDQKKDINGKILQIREAELNSLYQGGWRLPLCKNAHESYANPTGMTVQGLLEKVEQENYKPHTHAMQKDMELAQKFAKKREYLKKKKQSV